MGIILSVNLAKKFINVVNYKVNTLSIESWIFLNIDLIARWKEIREHLNVLSRLTMLLHHVLLVHWDLFKIWFWNEQTLNLVTICYYVPKVRITLIVAWIKLLTMTFRRSDSPKKSHCLSSLTKNLSNRWMILHMPL